MDKEDKIWMIQTCSIAIVLLLCICMGAALAWINNENDPQVLARKKINTNIEMFILSEERYGKMTPDQAEKLREEFEIGR